MWIQTCESIFVKGAIMEAISVKDVVKSYGAKEVLKGVSLSVNQKEVFGLLGENGAGKSTLIECVLGVKEVNQGVSEILGRNPQKDRKRLFQEVGVQFQQNAYQDKITVEEICRESASFYKDVQEHSVLLKQFGLENKKKQFVSELSGGERQRLFVVLALIPNPKVLFLDEITTGLDVQARRDVWEIILSLKKEGMSIFLVSHYMDEVEVLCDRIGVLKRGKLSFCGSIKDFIQQTPYDNLEDAYLWYIKEE